MKIKYLIPFVLGMAFVTIFATRDAGQLRHVVCFEFRADATQEQIDALIEAFKNLEIEIDEVKAFEWGLNNSPEGLDHGLTHIFQLTFDDEEGRDIYLPHPAHQAFIEAHGGLIEEVVVVDYNVK